MHDPTAEESRDLDDLIADEGARNTPIEADRAAEEDAVFGAFLAGEPLGLDDEMSGAELTEAANAMRALDGLDPLDAPLVTAAEAELVERKVVISDGLEFVDGVVKMDSSAYFDLSGEEGRHRALEAARIFYITAGQIQEQVRVATIEAEAFQGPDDEDYRALFGLLAEEVPDAEVIVVDEDGGLASAGTAAEVSERMNEADLGE